ncbi:MAG TPA: GAF domain-containing sensor histidine kinase [Actinomycetota bacterium]|nr:GAF domain-containing sensor histidine kinase [Actinomycetota bacterium]
MADAEPIAGTGTREDLEAALFEVATTLNKGVDRSQMLEQIAVQLQRLVPHTELMIGRVDPLERVVLPVFAQGRYADRKLALRIPYGEGLTGRVAETGRPVVHNQASTDDPTLVPGRVCDCDDDLGEEYVLAVPMIGPRALEGILVLYRQGPGQARWTADDLRLVELFAASAQLALQNAELHAAADKRAKRLAAMNEVLRCTSTGVEDADVRAICESWERALRELIPFTISGIALERPASETGECLAVWLSDTINFTLGQPLPPDCGPMWAIRHGRGYVLEDIRVHAPYGPHAGLEDGSVASVVIAPVKARGKAFGVIGLGHAEPGVYDQETLGLLEEVAVYLGAAIDNVLLYREVYDHRETQTRLVHKVISAREEERKKLATELHDDTIQVLAAALLHADQIAETTPEKQEKQLDKLRTTLESAMAMARRTMLNLRPPLLDQGGLRPALRQQLDGLEQEGITTELVWNLRGKLDEPVETLLFRSLQEALRNVRKHAHATRVAVELRGGPEDDLVVGTVRDNGDGFEVGDTLQQAIHGGHLGLHSMLEQAAVAGGAVDIDAIPEEGTTLTVSIPRKIGVPE